MRGVVKAYETSDSPFIALNDVNLDINPGEFLGITGKSGAGKTTLLNMISGVSDLTEGELLFSSASNGSSASTIPIHKLDEDKLALWRGQNLGIIYQSFELMPTLSLVDNVMLSPDLLGSYQPMVTKERALELLELVGIVDHAYKIPAHISGGQKQRVAIARALVNQPRVLLADEPTGNLDSKTSRQVVQILSGLRASQGLTIVMISHEEHLLREFADELIYLQDGEVVSRQAFKGDA